MAPLNNSHDDFTKDPLSTLAQCIFAYLIFEATSSFLTHFIAVDRLVLTEKPYHPSEQLLIVHIIGVIINDKQQIFLEELCREQNQQGKSERSPLLGESFHFDQGPPLMVGQPGRAKDAHHQEYTQSYSLATYHEMSEIRGRVSSVL